MKTIALTLFAFGVSFAQTSTPAAATATSKNGSKSTAAVKTKPAVQSKSVPNTDAKPQAPVQSIPAGAKQIEPNLYQYTDFNGRTWNYRQTPFGISKWEETSTPGAQPQSQPAQSQPQAAQPKSEPVTVTDLGDSYKFEKSTPFGHSSWTRKKSDLTDEERALAAPPSAAPAANSKPEGN